MTGGPGRDEPRRHPLFLALLGLAAVSTAPFALLGAPDASWLGIPVWLWASLGATACLAGLTAWGILRYWRDDRFD